MLVPTHLRALADTCVVNAASCRRIPLAGHRVRAGLGYYLAARVLRTSPDRLSARSSLVDLRRRAATSEHLYRWRLDVATSDAAARHEALRWYRARVTASELGHIIACLGGHPALGDD